MSDAAAESPQPPARSRKTLFALGMILMISGAGAGYYAVSSGLVSPPGNKGASISENPQKLPDIAFVALDPIMVSLNSDQQIQHLRFRAQLEVETRYKREVEMIVPRVVDVLNSYLRALELRDLRDPLALTRLRAQMLRRIQVVAGQGRVRDLLIMDFVLN